MLAIAVVATLMLQGTTSARQVRPNSAHPWTHAGRPVPRLGYGDSILFYGRTVGTERVTEVSIAEAMGFDVTIATKRRWATMSRHDFETYGAIVLADPGCEVDEDRLDVASANAKTWSNAIHGHVVITGTDPVWHLNRGTQPGPERLIANTLAYVSRGNGTGLAVSLSCYYWNARRDSPVPLLRHFGTFTVQGADRKPLPGCPQRVETPDPDHAMLAGLTADDLSGWGCSIHEAFDSMPYRFNVVAQHRGSDLPYIIAGRVGITSA